MHKILPQTVALALLVKDGFSSLKAMELLDAEDLATSKIPRGQQKLLLKATGEMCGELYNPLLMAKQREAATQVCLSPWL